MSFLKKLSLAATATVLLSDLAVAQPAPMRVVALGDSLTAGYSLMGGEDFASQLQTALVEKNVSVKIENAGVSGDTTAGSLGPQAVWRGWIGRRVGRPNHVW